MRRFPVYLVAASCLLAGAASAQNPIRVIFLGNSNVGGADPAIMTYLVSRYGKANVTYQDTEPSGTVKASTILGFDVAVLSSTPSSSRYRGKLHDSPTPIVNFEEAVADDNNPGEFNITRGRIFETEIIKIKIDIAHPITAGFAVNSTVTLTSQAEQVWWSSGAQAPGSVSLAHDNDDTGTPPTRMYLKYIEVGGNLLGGTRKATCRRVMFGIRDNSFRSFTPDGKKLLGQSVDWAAGGCCAKTSNYGTGLTGRNGIPTLTTSARPTFGANINLLASNSSGVATSGLMLIGLGQQTPSVPFLGGMLYVNPVLLGFLTVPPNGLVLPVSIPNSAALCTIAPNSLFFQVQLLQLDTAAAAGVSMTPGMQLKTGK